MIGHQKRASRERLHPLRPSPLPASPPSPAGETLPLPRSGRLSCPCRTRSSILCIFSEPWESREWWRLRTTDAYEQEVKLSLLVWPYGICTATRSTRHTGYGVRCRAPTGLPKAQIRCCRHWNLCAVSFCKQSVPPGNVGAVSKLMLEPKASSCRG